MALTDREFPVSGESRIPRVNCSIEMAVSDSYCEIGCGTFYGCMSTQMNSKAEELSLFPSGKWKGVRSETLRWNFFSCQHKQTEHSQKRVHMFKPAMKRAGSGITMEVWAGCRRGVWSFHYRLRMIKMSHGDHHPLQTSNVNLWRLSLHTRVNPRSARWWVICGFCGIQEFGFLVRVCCYCGV